MKMKNFISGKFRLVNLWAAALVTLAVATATIGRAQTPPAASQDLQEIVKFTQAHMTDDVIVSYIKNSGKTYSLSADDMLYLNSQGVSQTVLSALLAAKPAGAPAPETPAPAPAPPPAAPEPAPAPAYVPSPGLADNFAMDGGLNPGLWTPSSSLLAGLAAVHGSAWIQPYVSFGPGGMRMRGASVPGQFTGIQSVASYMAPFSFTATVYGLEERAVPFQVSLVSADMRQWLSLTGHLGGAGHREGDVHVFGGGRGFGGGINIPLGERRSPEHGVWVNYTGSAMPLAAMGMKIFEDPHAGVPYTIQMTVGPDGMASVTFLNPEGMALGGRSGLYVGTGPFNVVLANRNGAADANWNTVQLAPLGPPPEPPPPPVPAVAPQVPTLDYYQGQLGPYGQWIDVPGIGPAWIPAEAADPFWRPYFNSGHWEFTDAGWFWHSDYSWGEITFHYGRWFKDERTGFQWAWAPGYDWAPSWVAWRYAEGPGYMGWAPLPWEARYQIGVGLTYRGAVAVDIDFGVGPSAFVFVGHDHFFEADYRSYAAPEVQVNIFFGASVIHNGYREDHGHFVAEGWGREHVAAFTHHEVVMHQARELRQSEEHHNLEARRQEHAYIVAHPGQHLDGHGKPAALPRREVAKPNARPGERANERENTAHPGTREAQPNARPTAEGQERSTTEHGTTAHPGGPDSKKPTTNAKTPPKPKPPAGKPNESGEEKKPNGN
jgi:hypothetical protein